MTLDDIRREYDAVFIGVGAHRNLPIRVPGEDLPGVKGGAQFFETDKADYSTSCR